MILEHELTIMTHTQLIFPFKNKLTAHSLTLTWNRWQFQVSLLPQKKNAKLPVSNTLTINRLTNTSKTRKLCLRRHSSNREDFLEFLARCLHGSMDASCHSLLFLLPHSCFYLQSFSYFFYVPFCCIVYNE